MLSFLAFTVIAVSIVIGMSNDDTRARMAYYKSESDKVVMFFNSELKPRILMAMDTSNVKFPFDIQLTGSHRSGLAYPARSFEDRDNKDAKDGEASDLDFAFVADTLSDLSELQRVFTQDVLIKNKLCGDASLDSKQADGLNRLVFFMGGQFKTKKGLPWIPANNCQFITKAGAVVRINKLDCTFRTTKQHNFIQQHVESQLPLKFTGDEAKVSYIETLRKLKTAKAEFIRNGDKKAADECETQYMKAKEWLVCDIPDA
jgi:hypothetical protein